MKSVYLLLIAPIFFFPFLLFSQNIVGTKVTGTAISEFYGKSVSISDNGSFLAVGGEGYNSFSGVVRVYEYQGGDWMQIGSNIEGDASNAQFGSSLSISSNGSIFAAGAPNGSSYKGYVGIYENQGGSWTQIAYIEGFGSNALSGGSVDLSPDGTMVAIGASNFNSGRGYLRVYENQSGTWVQKGTDIYGENAGDQFGYDVSLSSDGLTVAVSSRNYLANNTGDVKIYEFISDDWVLKGTNIVGEGSGAQFGYDVCLSSSGTILAVSGPNNNGANGSNTGHVKVYEYTGGDWMQIGSDIEGEVSGDGLGTCISLSSDGTIVAAGSISHNSLQGYVKIYQYSGGDWSQIGSDVDGESVGDQSGYSVNLSSNASYVAIGSHNSKEYGNFTGHARVFDLSALLSSDEVVLSKFSLYPNPAKNKFTIELREGLELENVNIYNQVGQFISSAKTNTIKTNTLSSGIYFVEITTNQGKATKKIAIE